jgi:pimeloyl-ACP methyl ester carboxylesterase
MRAPLIAILSSALVASCVMPPRTHDVGAPPSRAAIAPPRTREIDVDAGDHTLHVRVAGDVHAGPPLVVIPGGPGSSFHYLLPFDQLVTPTRAVVLVDPRGVAPSTRPRSTAWTLADFAEDTEAIRRALGVRRIHLAGHSAGGLFAMAYAAFHPSRLASLVLVDSGPPDQRLERALDERFARRMTALVAAGLVPKELPVPEDGGDCMPYVRALAPMFFADPRGARATAFLDAFGKRGDTCTDISEPIARGIGRFDLRDALSAVTARTLIVRAGIGVLGDSGDDVAEELSLALPHARVEKIVIPACGHLLFVECPTPFFAAVATFLGD